MTGLCGLRVDLGEPVNRWVPGGRWLRPPAADFRCACGFEDAASGDQVPGFVASVWLMHAAVCSLRLARGP